MSMSPVVALCRQSCWWDFLGAGSVLTGRQPHCRLPDPHALWSFCSLIPCDKSLRYKSYVIDVSVGTGLHNCAFRLVVAFCNGIFLLQKEFPWCRMRSTLSCGSKDRDFECTLGCCLFSKVTVVGSPPRSITSPALGNWLGFQYQVWLPSDRTGLKFKERTGG